MVYKRLNTGMFGSNCYIAGDNGEGVIIDPGADPKDIMDAVQETGLKIKYIILTHCHIDHICSMDAVREKTGARVAIHKDDADSLGDSLKNGSKLFGLSRTFKAADIFLEDEQILEVGGLNLEIMHTPGHSPGCICIKAENSLFTGDTLFRMSVGRTDLGNGSTEELLESLKRLMALDDDLIVYPGHGTSTSIGYEKMYNPYV